MAARKFKDLTIRDAFMFAAVMSDPEICRRVLESVHRIISICGIDAADGKSDKSMWRLLII